MFRLGRFSRVLFLVALITSACGGDPPEKEMQQAQGAIDAARAAGADQWAHEEYVAARESLQNARDAVGARDYRLALDHALDSRERAQSAAKQAADNKAIARVDADHALVNAAAALAEARTRLKAAAASRGSAPAVVAARRTIADSEAAVQKARAAFKEGDYRLVIGTVPAATSRLRGAARDLEALVSPRSRRRRSGS